MPYPGLFLAALLVLLGSALRGTGAENPQRVTFTRDVAPVIFGHCVRCHHEGGAAPFALTSYAPAKKRAKQILEMVQQREMPPWLPAPGVSHFEGEDLARLTDAEIALIARWVGQGAVEGNRAHLPPLPPVSREWELGPPDLVAEMPEDFVLPAEGRDVYRNFVLPVKLPEGRWVRATEIRPGSQTIVHHALLYLDLEDEARRNEERGRATKPNEGPGFSGMNAGNGVSSPPGGLVSWQPGRKPRPQPEGMAWRLEKDINLVLQLHLRPSGKPERLRAKVGLYFTDTPPITQPFTMLLRSTSLDIPAGEANYVVESHYRTPVALRVHGLLPHAHYLCREMKGWVTLPDGTERPLIHIPQWNFDWQSDYRFIAPVEAPADSTLHMRYIYDNSSANTRNPAKPPQRCQFGLETTDEMAELWLQVTAAREAERAQLSADYRRTFAVPDALALATNLLKRTPDDPALLERRGRALALSGREAEAIAEVRRATELDPSFAKAQATLGLFYLGANQDILAQGRLESAVALDPSDHRSINALGWMQLQQGNTAKARTYFEQALRLKPNDPVILGNLRKTLPQ